MSWRCRRFGRFGVRFGDQLEELEGGGARGWKKMWVMGILSKYPTQDPLSLIRLLDPFLFPPFDLVLPESPLKPHPPRPRLLLLHPRLFPSPLTAPIRTPLPLHLPLPLHPPRTLHPPPLQIPQELRPLPPLPPHPHSNPLLPLPLLPPHPRHQIAPSESLQILRIPHIIPIPTPLLPAHDPPVDRIDADLGVSLPGELDPAVDVAVLFVAAGFAAGQVVGRSFGR